MEACTHTLFMDKIKLAKKGQVTIPKVIRDEDGLRENDIFIVTHLPGGEILLRKQEEKKPEDFMLQAIAKAPLFNAKAAWREVRQERLRERT